MDVQLFDLSLIESEELVRGTVMSFDISLYVYSFTSCKGMNNQAIYRGFI